MYQQCNGESIYSFYMNKYIWIHLCMYLEEQSENADKQKQKQEQRKKKKNHRYSFNSWNLSAALTKYSSSLQTANLSKFSAACSCSLM